jgi:hypothetical protein
MFQNHTTPWRIYITTDKLRLNKPLQMLLASFVSSKSWAVEVASEVPHASVAKHRLMQVTEQLQSSSSRWIQFFSCRESPSSVDCQTVVSASRNKYDTPVLAVRLCHPAVWNMADMTLEINLYELTAPFECCVLETERMETRGNSLRFWNKKCIKWVKKKLFHHQICYFLRRKFCYVGMH